MSFPLDIDELFHGDLSQYDSNDFSEMNSVFQRDFNRSPSLDRSNMDQQLTLTSFSTNKKEKEKENENEKKPNKKIMNENNDLDEDLRKRFQLLTTDMEITGNVTNKQNNNKNKIETEKNEKETEKEKEKEKEKENQQQMEQEKEQPKKKENEIEIEQTNERSLYQQQKQKQKQKRLQQQQPNKFNNFELKDNDNVEDEDINEVQKGTSKYGRNIQSKFRKRDLKKPTQSLRNKVDPNNMIRENSTVVESGKEVYKLLVGVLWVMSGGASIKTLTPFSDTITKKIGELLNASETEEKNFKKQLKYLLTNSRRTFTEYILEILIGILSLRFVSESEEESDISVQFWDTLTEIVEIDLKLKKIGQSQNSNENEENERMKQIKKKEELHLNLQKIYQRVFTPKTLMFWFNKRFIDRLDAFFGPSLADKFYKEHFCYFGKSKFMLSCLILAGELIKQDGIAKRYSELIDLEYESDPLNLYSNNRGKKQGLIKELIVKYQLNGGQYWKVLSREYMKQLKFDDSNVFDFFPFKEIIGNPLFTSLCSGYGQQMLTQKKRVLATKGNVIENVFNIGWIMKKEN
ncbi:a-type inclusion protein [Anaeramoeba flamelloides]|uniref:A-type inclusion protein n=1 Tax=Anaeramoeba flamelloides TaxID=1746091 RepID=A0ABQ8Z430_9EUKA|nr:a-type inclusion protein [Anaeramoeba flamelloides]